MKDSFNNVRQHLSEYWTNLTKSQKIKLSSIVIGSIVLLVVLTVIFTRPITVPLYSSPLAEDKAAEVAAKLDDLKYSYSLEASTGGEIINVNESEKEKIKLALSEAGLPKGKGYTYEDAINGDSISTPNEVRQSKFLLAKQDELAQTLTQIEGVKDATVNLNIPEKAVFAEDQEQSKPTAAINLVLDNELSKAQVKGIVDFVAKSVENLEPKNITVINQEGTQLNSSNDENSDNSNSVDKQFTLKVKSTEYRKKQVEDLFSQMGMSDVKVNVNLVMNFDTQVTDSTTYTTTAANGNGYVSSQDTTNKSGTGVEGSSAPGTTTNVTIQYPASGNNNYSMKEKTNKVNYNVDKVRKKTQLALGTEDPTKSSIAVMLYKKGKVYTDKTAYDKATSKITSVPNLVSTVQNATGFTNVTVQQVVVPVYEPQAGIDYGKLFRTYGPFALAAMLLLGLLAGFLKGDKKKENSQEEIDVEEFDMEQEQAALEGPSFEARIGAEDELPDIEVSKDSEVQNQINKFVKEKPDAVAQLLKNWLNEDWE